MSERNKEIVRSRLAGLTYGDIAMRLGISRNAVAGVLFKAGMTDHADPRSSRASRNRCNDGFRAVVLKTAAEVNVSEAARRWMVSRHTIHNWRREAAA